MSFTGFMLILSAICYAILVVLLSANLGGKFIHRSIGNGGISSSHFSNRPFNILTSCQTKQSP